MTKREFIRESNGYRLELDNVLQRLEKSARESRPRNMAMTKIEEAIMWLGKDLRALHQLPSCYEHGGSRFDAGRSDGRRRCREQG